MPNWTAFFGITGVVLVLLLVLSRLSAGAVTDEPPAETATEESSIVLLANVALSQGLFAAVLVIGLWFSRIPLRAIGVSSIRLDHLAVGVCAGVLLYLGNVFGAIAARRLGYRFDLRLREQLTPRTAGGWVVLLVGVLPLISVFEELLFRGILIGTTSAATGVSPWLFAGGSSVLFAVGHSAQGRLGVVITGLLGFALAIVFVLTNSLLAVVLAHFLINALEFVFSDRLESALTGQGPSVRSQSRNQ